MNLIKWYRIRKIKKDIMRWFKSNQPFMTAYLAPTVIDLILHKVVSKDILLVTEALKQLVMEDKLVFMLESYYLKGYEPKL